MPRDSRIAPKLAAAMPLPRLDTTPPVTKTYLAMKMQVREIRMIADIFALAENIWQMDAPE
jgi:hypothetical protein